MRQCIGCDATVFEPRPVTWTVTIGGNAVTHAHVESVCSGCGWWAIRARDLWRFELLTAQRVLLEQSFTSEVARGVRKALGFTCAGLAQRLGVSEETICAWEDSEPPAPWVPLALGGLVAVELLAPPKPVELEYRARIYADGDAWSVEFPDCPGCLTFGDTIDEAEANAQEALEGWLEVHVCDGEPPPKPSAEEGEAIRIDGELAARVARLWSP